MKIFRSLKGKLFFIVLMSFVATTVPCLYVSNNFFARIDKCKSQQKAVELLGCVAEITNQMYAKEYSPHLFDKAKIANATETLSEYYSRLSIDNVKIRAFFSKSALSSFQQKKICAGYVSDMSALITERALLFSDSQASIRILMEVSGSSIPSIMSDLIAYRASLSAVSNTSSANMFSHLVFQARSMAFKLGKTSSSGDFKIAPEIYEKTNRLALQLGKIERLLASQNQDGKIVQVAESVDALEGVLFDIWVSANKNLNEMLVVKLRDIETDFICFWMFFFSTLIFICIVVLLVSRNVLKGLSNISDVVKFTTSGKISEAKDVLDNIISKDSNFGELNECVFALVNYMSELVLISKNVANVSNKINLMLSGMNATKMQLLVSIKDSFAEINRQIRSDYDFVLQEVSALGECSSLALEIERNLKSSKKIWGNLNANIYSISDFSASISEKLNECKVLFGKISSIVNVLADAADKMNLLGLNLSIIAQKLGTDSEGAETLSSQIRSVSRQVAVAVADVETVGESLSQLISQSQADNLKISEFSEQSMSASKEIDLLAGKSWSEVSNVGSCLNSVASSLRSNVSSNFDCDASIQDLDDIRDSIKDIAAIVKKSSENIENLRSKLKVF